MNDTLAHKATSGALWASMDRVVYMGMQFIVNLILSHILNVNDFGIIGMLYIFIAVSNAIVDSGFASALIQKKAPTQSDYSTVFFWNLIFAVALYLILFLAAPLIERFYHRMEGLADVLRVFSLIVISNGICATQIARLKKQLEFKKIAITNLTAFSLASIFSVISAYNGAGVWSLVMLQLIYGILNILLLFLVSRWVPSLCFSRKSIRELFSFGGFLMAATILQEFCKNIQGLIIGHRFSSTIMGYTSQAQKLEQTSCNALPQVIAQVMYPVYSSIQDDTQRIRQIIAMNIRVISLMVFPMVCILIIFAENIITLLYGHKWLPSVPYFQVLCVGGLFSCLQNTNFFAVASRGKSRKLFVWSFYKWGFLLAAIVIGMWFGIYGILWAMVLGNINIYLTNAWLVDREIGFKILHQLKLLVPIAATTACAFTAACAVAILLHSKIAALAVFLTVFLSIEWFTDRATIMACLDLLKSLRRKI